MNVLQRYFTSEIMRAVLFVLIAFLALFVFFDLIGELQAVGRGSYRLQHAFLYVLMGLPRYMYELMPIAALIGTIYTLSQFAARSEFTIMRAASMSTWMVGKMLAKIGLVFVVFTFLVGEFVAPVMTQMAERLKVNAQGATLAKEFRTGLWTKDQIKEGGTSGKVIGSRFINIRETGANGQLQGVNLYEFDTDFRLISLVTAKAAQYQGNNIWRLDEVSETNFPDTAPKKGTLPLAIAASISTTYVASRNLVSEITPDVLSVVFSDPDKMSAYDLATYKKHLAENKQDTERYQIAFWKKIIYPFAIFVMMALALPFAYLHFRSGGVSLKIFSGIMIGVSFLLLNSLFSHLGLLNTWPAFITAILPSAIFLLIAISALRWVERH